MKLSVSCFLLLLCLALSASAISVEEMAAQPSVLDLVTPVVATASNSASGAAFAEESELQIQNKNAVATASTSAAGEAFPDASELQVEDSSSSSANAALDPPANWNGWKWTPVQIGGAPTNKNILAACTAKGLKTPCDNPAYNDGKCVTVFSAHLSYPPQNSANKILFHKFFYTNNGASTLYNDGSSHRWSNSNDADGVTLCVSFSAESDTWNGWNWTPVQFSGAANSANIMAACKAKGLLTPCDNPSYNDGKCVTAFAGGHLSYPPQNSANKLLFEKFFYCGTANGVQSLYNTGSTHRWSTSSDANGVTLCVDWPKESQAKVDWNGWTFIPTNVTGKMTSANIYATCKAARLETPCDHPEYSDGQCVTVFTGHLSLTASHSGFSLTDNKCFYAGTQSSGMSLCSTVSSHRWATTDNENGETLCVTGNALKQKPQNWNGWWWVPTDIKGVVNSASILAACTSAGLQTPCDTGGYHDGKCITISSSYHMSTPRSDFFLNYNKFFYCGSANSGLSLYNTGAKM